MRAKICAQCPYTPWDLAGHYGRDANLHLCVNCEGERKASTKEYPANPRGRKNAQQFQMYPRRRNQALPDLRRQIRARQALFLADRALFKEVRRPFQEPSGM